MTSRAQRLSAAMSYLDEELIEEAHAESRGRAAQVLRRRKTAFQVGLVACLCVVALAVTQLPTWNETGGDMAQGGEMAPGDGMNDHAGEEVGAADDSDIPDEIAGETDETGEAEETARETDALTEASSGV